jgi:hypothetical protein
VRVAARSEADMSAMLAASAGGCMMKDRRTGREEEEERSEEDGTTGDGSGEAVTVGKSKDVLEAGEGAPQGAVSRGAVRTVIHRGLCSFRRVQLSKGLGFDKAICYRRDRFSLGRKGMLEIGSNRAWAKVDDDDDRRHRLARHRTGPGRRSWWCCRSGLGSGDHHLN